MPEASAREKVPMKRNTTAGTSGMTTTGGTENTTGTVGMNGRKNTALTGRTDVAATKAGAVEARTENLPLLSARRRTMPWTLMASWVSCFTNCIT
ncbi:MAG: hypothetical protein HDT38_03020 [Clostridiales bacterium]|nr:hypothetical protein [Clostridiales bacterium]